MRRVVAALVSAFILLVELALSLIVLVIGLWLMAAAPPIPDRPLPFVAVAVAVAVALTPVLLTIGVGFKRFLSRAGGGIPLSIGLPAVAIVICLPLLVGGMRAGGSLVARAEAARTRSAHAAAIAERASLRAMVEGGATHRACDLVVNDPMATPDDMKRCRLRIESLADPVERWSEMLKFTDGPRGFKSWDPYELELVPAWDLNNRLVVVRHDQEWFVRTFYETWLARPDAFHAGEDREQLVSCIEAMGDWFGWKPSVSDVFSVEILPRLTERLAAESERLPLHPDEIRTTADAIDRVHKRARTERSPPRPQLAAPANAIGMARVEDRVPRELHLWLRSSATSGDIGDVYLWYDGPWYDPFEPMLDHLGNPAPGFVVAVPPIPNSPSED